MITIKTLLENSGSRNRSLLFEHGLSFLITINENSYLFDCSSGDKFLKNARKMNVDLSKIKSVILSHSHFDHCCGFLDLVENFKISNIYTGKSFFDTKYSFDGLKYSYLGCGFDKDFLKKNNISHTICENIIELEKNLFIVGNFKRNYEFETSPKRFVVDRGDKIEVDNFEDEICIVIKTSKGLVVVTGCSHPGILNMLSGIKDIFNEKIYAVYGGTHLVEADDSRLEKTLEEMKKFGVKILGFSHCSGEKIVELIKKEKEFLSCQLNTGDEIKIF